VFAADDAVLVLGAASAGAGSSGSRSSRGHRAGGTGRAVARAAAGLVPAGEPLWAQVAPGNAASLRAVTAAGFVPVGAEVRFPRAAGNSS